MSEPVGKTKKKKRKRGKGEKKKQKQIQGVDRGVRGGGKNEWVLVDDTANVKSGTSSNT